MTDRDRLIELFKKIKYTPFTEMTMKSNLGNQFTDYALNCIVDELLANGVIVPPCKVGQTVYYLARNIHTHIEKVTSGKVVRIAITESGIDLFVNNYVAKLPYGKRSFLTKEEAEEKLKELG